MNFSECSRLCLNILNLNFITNLDYSTVIYILWMNNGGLSNLSMVLEWVSGGSRIQNCIALGSRAHTFIHNTTSSIQSLSHVWFFVIQWTAARQASLSITNSQSLLKLTSMESVMPSNHLILCRPLFLPSIFPSIRVFSNESILHIGWPKYWSFSFSISRFNEYSGLLSFRIECFDQAPLSVGFFRQEYWSGLPFPSAVDHILSDLSTMTHPSWVAPRAWLSFIERIFH